MLLSRAWLRGSALLLLSVLASIAPFDAAKALLVTWSFTGTVRDIENPDQLPPELGSLGVAVGAPVSGFAQIDTDTPGSNPPTPGLATNSFPGAVKQAALTIAEWSLVDPNPLSGGTYVIGEIDLGPGEYVNSSIFSLQLTKEGSSLWDSAVMLTTPPPLAELSPYGLFSFPSTYFIHGTQLEVDQGAAKIHVELASLVPEPAAAALALLAGLLLGSLRSARR